MSRTLSPRKNFKKRVTVKKKQYINEDKITQYIKKKESKHPINLAFNKFAEKISDWVGNAWSFIFALSLVIIWSVSGRFFNYSDTWQLVINTGTTIITFLVVFIIQNTQNRDTEILNLKIDELILAKKGARNRIINLNSLSDIELKQLEKEYIRLCNKRTGK